MISIVHSGGGSVQFGLMLRLFRIIDSSDPERKLDGAGTHFGSWWAQMESAAEGAVLSCAFFVPAGIGSTPAKTLVIPEKRRRDSGEICALCLRETGRFSLSHR